MTPEVKPPQKEGVLTSAFDGNNKEIIDIHIHKLYGQTITKDSILTKMFEPGYSFQLYCKDCWETQEMYNDEENDNESLYPDDESIDSYDSDYYNDIEDDDNEIMGLDSYHVGKGRYDLY